jgi:hypothetical protein
MWSSPAMSIGHDIGFGVTFQRTDGGGGGGAVGGSVAELVPWHRRSPPRWPAVAGGAVTALADGVVTLVWDNSFSWVDSKAVVFVVYGTRPEHTADEPAAS